MIHISIYYTFYKNLSNWQIQCIWTKTQEKQQTYNNANKTIDQTKVFRVQSDTKK